MSDDLLVSVYTDAQKQYNPYEDHPALCRINYRWSASDNYYSLTDVWLLINKYKTYQHKAITELDKFKQVVDEFSEFYDDDYYNNTISLATDIKEQQSYIDRNSKEVLIDLKTRRVDITPLFYHATNDEITKTPTTLYNLGKQWMTFDEFDKTYRKIRVKIKQENNLFKGQDDIIYLI